MTTHNLFVAPANRGYGWAAVTITAVAHPSFLLRDWQPPTYRVELGRHDIIGYHRESDLAEVSDRRRAKRIARKEAKRRGLIPRSVFHRRKRELDARADEALARHRLLHPELYLGIPDDPGTD